MNDANACCLHVTTRLQSTNPCDERGFPSLREDVCLPAPLAPKAR